MRAQGSPTAGFSSPATGASGADTGTPTDHISGAISNLAATIQPLTQQIQNLTLQIQSLNYSLMARSGGSVAVTPGGGIAMAGAAGGGYWGNVLSNAQWSGFYPQSIVNAMIAQLPGISGGVAASAMLLMNTGIDAQLALTRPPFETNVQLQSATRAGQYVHPATAAGMQQAAELQGILDSARSWGRLFDWFPLWRREDEQNIYRPLERMIAFTRADTMRASYNRTIALYGGQPVLDLNDPTAEAQVEGVAAFGGFGREAVRASQRLNYRWGLGRNVSPRDYGEVLGDIARLSGNLGLSGLREQVYGGDIEGAMQSYLGIAAGRGDFGRLNMARRLGFSEDQIQAAIATGVASSETQFQSELQGQTLAQMRYTGAGYKKIQQQIEGMRSTLLTRREQLSYEPLAQAEIDVQRAGLYYTGETTMYGQRGQIIGAERIRSALGVQRSLFSSNDPEAAFNTQRNQALRQANLYTEMSRRSDIFDPGLITLFSAQAEQAAFEANYAIPRAYAEEMFGRGMAQATGGYISAVTAASRARIFGGGSAISGTAAGVASGIDDQIAQLRNLMDHGLRNEREKLEISNQIKQLEKEKMEQVQAIFQSGEMRSIGAAGTRLTESGATAQIGFLRGVGGTAGVGLAVGIVGSARGLVNQINQSIRKARQEGYEEDSEFMQNLRNQLAQAQVGETQAEIGMGSTPLSIGIQRSLSAGQYQVQALSMLPGAYGNIRGALQGQLRTLQRAAEELTGMRASALANASPENREAIDFAFQQRMQQIGLQQASVFQQLSYGWESRLISQALGTPGNFGSLDRRFSYMSAVLGGVRNPHFGASAADQPYFMSQALYPGSIAGATGTPAGFGVTALTGAAPQSGFRENLPNFSAAPPTQNVKLEIMLKWPDGSDAGRATLNTAQGGGSLLSSFEDLQRILVTKNAGNY
jgi:hypothetical protein